MRKYRRLGIALFLVISILYVIFTYSGSFIQSAIETVGPKVLGVRVKVGEVYLVPILGTASVRGLKIENLPGYTEKYLFEVGTVSFSLNLKSLLKEMIVIHSIEVNSPIVAWEGTLSESNVTKLQDRIGRGSSKGSAARKILVENLAIQNTQVIARVGKNAPMRLTLPLIALHNVRSDQKAEAVGKIVGIVIAELSKQIVLEIARHPELLVNIVRNPIGGIVDGVMGLFGK